MGARTRKMSGNRKRKRNGVMGSRKRRKMGARDTGVFKTGKTPPGYVKTSGKLPMGLRVKQPYWYTTKSSTQGATSSVVSIWTKIFRINSTYDPEYAVGGTQPMGRDQLAALYAGYIVNACDMTFKLFEFTGTAGNLVVYGVYFTNTATPVLNEALSLKQNIELLSNRKTRAHYRYRDVAHDTTKNSTIRQVYKPKVLNPNEDIEHMTAAVGANPTVGQYAHFFVLCDLGESQLPFAPVIRLSYDVTYYDLIPFTAS